jgi:spermidine synthase
VVQSTSPFVAPKSFWCVNETLKASGFQTIPYHNYVPSFGEWGYIMACIPDDFHLPVTFPIEKKYISAAVMEQMLQFPDDMLAHEPLEVNKLNNQALVNYFEKEWGKYLEQ